MSPLKYDRRKIYVFYCANCCSGDDFEQLFQGENENDYKIISLPCSGKADLLYLLKAFETGADGLALVTCPNNECHYLEGNLRAPKRTEEANAILAEAGMGGNRVIVLRRHENGMGEIVSRIAEFRDKIRNMTLNT
jgi:coenzyme F420-reducing hydrogenase delta subunit